MAAGRLQRWLGWLRKAWERTAPPPSTSMAAASTAVAYDPRAEYLKTLAEARVRLELQSYKVEEAYDRTMVTLAGGALAISITFLEKVAPHPVPKDTVWILWVSWGSFVVSLLAILVSMLTSQRAFGAALG